LFFIYISKQFFYNQSNHNLIPYCLSILVIHDYPLTKYIINKRFWENALTKGTSGNAVGDFYAFFYFRLFLSEKKMIYSDIQPFQPLAHSFEEIDFLNNYCSNLKRTV